MPKTLLAVVSCHTRPEFSDAVRNTWASEIPKDKADTLFFMGKVQKYQKKTKSYSIAEMAILTFQRKLER